MSSWVQPVDTPAERVNVAYVTAVDAVWERDVARTFFEGRTYPVTARSERVTQEWSATAVWGSQTRAAAEAYLSLLRDAALSDDTRLEVHFEPANGAYVDAVVQAVDVPQGLGVGRTDVTVTFRRVE